ncbi:hypothetical protein DICVIV_13676 [Dictyocaulus viviparus]|uniref:Integrase zinc-binding domain-containing protein n=1 Tax=Dictyocaulus viviparus TaxID=29172 RepID=A0A0D8X779_DICVI|nr:hypothetical protein DICVIV_13676 [Dictyocaulus viviparus]
MITQDAHLPYHSGTSQTMANVREKFWIPKLRQQTRKPLRRCIGCQKMNNLPYKYPKMDDLPESRRDSNGNNAKKSLPVAIVSFNYFRVQLRNYSSYSLRNPSRKLI